VRCGIIDATKEVLNSNSTFDSRGGFASRESLQKPRPPRSYNPDAYSTLLWDLAQQSTSLSGRTLRRLPYVALALYGKHDRCTVREALDALSRAISDHREDLKDGGIETVRLKSKSLSLKDVE
jgi:hypothetical protein